MTAVRLANAEILLHSPCRPSPGLVEEIGRIGQVTQVVAPNWFHDLYLAEYRALYPTSTFWAPRFLQRHQKSIVDDVLDGANRPPWFSELPYISVPGLLTFDECVFFQNRTRTLIVADLLMNASVSPDAPRVTRLGYPFVGARRTVKSISSSTVVPDRKPGIAAPSQATDIRVEPRAPYCRARDGYRRARWRTATRLVRMGVMSAWSPVLGCLHFEAR